MSSTTRNDTPTASAAHHRRTGFRTGALLRQTESASQQQGSSALVPDIAERGQNGWKENAVSSLQSGTPIPIDALCVSSLRAEACRARGSRLRNVKPVDQLI